MQRSPASALIALTLLVRVVGFSDLAQGASVSNQKHFSRMDFVVLRNSNGKPVRNASVILHPVNKKGRQQRGGLELKTDAEGKTSFDGIPYGKLRVQVIAPGLQTFGEDYDINQPTHELVIKLLVPQEQVTIYK